MAQLAEFWNNAKLLTITVLQIIHKKSYSAKMDDPFKTIFWRDPPVLNRDPPQPAIEI
jgi:hypothetical protein